MAYDNPHLKADRTAFSWADTLVRQLATDDERSLTYNGLDISPILLSQCFYHLRVPARRYAAGDALDLFRKRSLGRLYLGLLKRVCTGVGTKFLRPQPRRSERKSVVFLPTHHVHFRIVRDALLAARRDGIPVEVALWPGVDADRQLDGPYTRLLLDFSSIADLWRLDAERRRLYRIAQRANAGEGLPTFDWPAWIGLMWIESVWLVRLLERLFQVRNAGVVVLTQDQTPLGQAAALVIRAAGGKSLNVQHGVIGTGVWSHHLQYDRFALFGQASFDVLIREGVPVERLEVTGAPHFDYLFRKRRAPNMIVKELGMSIDRPHRILFASQWGHINNPAELREATLEAVCKAARAIPGCYLMVKKHPLENDGLSELVCTKIFGEHGNAISYGTFSETDLADLIYVSSVVATRDSTVGIEAAALNVPVLVVNLTGSPSRVPYAHEGIGLEARTPEEVALSLEALLFNADLRKRMIDQCRPFTTRYSGLPDGGAASRLYAALADLYENAQRPGASAATSHRETEF